MAGNDKSVYRTIGARNFAKEDREENDFYATSPIAIDALLKHEKFKGGVLEPSCGMGHLSKRLESFGYDVVSYDKVNRGYGKVKDFYTLDKMPTGCNNIITNPPFVKHTDFIIHSLNLVEKKGGKVAMLLKTTYLEGKERYERLFKIAPPKMIIQFVDRLVCMKNGDFDNSAGGTIAYAWFIWEKGYKGKTTIEWEYSQKKE